MSQRVRRNESPTSNSSTAGSATAGGAASGGTGGAGVGNSGVSLISRLLPMKATVPFQLRAQVQSQHPLQARSPHGADGGGSTRSDGCNGRSGEVGARASASLSRSPTPLFSSLQPLSSPPSAVATAGTQIVAATSPSLRDSPIFTPQVSTSGSGSAAVRTLQSTHSLSGAAAQQLALSPPNARVHGYGGSPCSSPTQQQQQPWLTECPPPTPPLPPSDLPPSGGHRGRVQQPPPQRWSPEHGRQSPERRSPSSPLSKEKPRVPPASPLCCSSSSIRRTSSLDALAGPYLSGHWPRDGSHAHCAPCMRDKSTQTPSTWADDSSEKRRGSHKRSASWGSTDQLKEIAKLRQQLQRSKHSSRHQRDKDRKSPFNGSHAAIGQSQAPIPKSILVPIPIAKSTVSRFRNSVEGLNQEIERIIIRDPGERDEQLILQDIPDGHRAPPPLPQRSSSTRSIDTQTPGGSGCPAAGAPGGSNSSSRSQSTSPSFLTVTSDTGAESPGDELLTEGREKDPYPSSPLPKYASSPKPNNSYMFKREPPEGCERVRVFEETLPRQPQEIPQFLCPDRNKVNFIPKSGSAFCLVSILKPLLPTQELTFKGSASLGGHGPAPSTGSTPLCPEPDQRISRGTSTSCQQSCLPRHLEETES